MLPLIVLEATCRAISGLIADTRAYELAGATFLDAAGRLAGMIAPI